MDTLEPHRSVECRILVIATEAFGGRGGIATVTRDVIRSLTSEQTSVVVTAHVLHAPDGWTHDLGWRYTQYVATGKAHFVAQVLRSASRISPTHVYVNHIHLAPLGALIARAWAAQLILHTHGIEVWSSLSYYRLHALLRADAVIAVSRDTRRRLMSQCNLTPERIRVINNCVGDEFRPVTPIAARASLNLSGSPLLLTVGRLSSQERYKGHDLVLDSLPRIARLFPNVRYIIAGDGDDRSRLEARTSELGISSNVLFLGYVDPLLLPNLYASADLFVMPSSGEGFGLSFVESMASGTPALGLNEGGAADALVDGSLGITTTREALTDTIISTLSEPILTQDLANRARTIFSFYAFSSSIRGVFGLQSKSDTFTRNSSTPDNLEGRGSQ